MKARNSIKSIVASVIVAGSAVIAPGLALANQSGPIGNTHKDRHEWQGREREQGDGRERGGFVNVAAITSKIQNIVKYYSDKVNAEAAAYQSLLSSASTTVTGSVYGTTGTSTTGSGTALPTDVTDQLATLQSLAQSLNNTSPPDSILTVLNQMVHTIQQMKPGLEQSINAAPAAGRREFQNELAHAKNRYDESLRTLTDDLNAISGQTTISKHEFASLRNAENRFVEASKNYLRKLIKAEERFQNQTAQADLNAQNSQEIDD